MFGNPLNPNLNPHWRSLWGEAMIPKVVQTIPETRHCETIFWLKCGGRNTPPRFTLRVDLVRIGSCDYWLLCVEEFNPLPNEIWFAFFGYTKHAIKCHNARSDVCDSLFLIGHTTVRSHHKDICFALTTVDLRCFCYRHVTHVWHKILSKLKLASIEIPVE